MDFKIVELEDKHICDVVDVHMRAFPGFFTTFLGPGFVKEIHKYYLSDPTEIGFVAEDNQTGEVLGFIVGPMSPNSCFKKLVKKRWLAFGLASITAVLKRPVIIKRLLRGFFYRGDPPQGSKRAYLSGVAVCPKAQKKGLGRALVETWVQEVAQRDGTGCYLTTDTENNEAINSFYLKLGWKVESTYTTPEGRVMNRYILDLPQTRE